MLRFGEVSEVLVDCTQESSEGEYELGESPATCGAKTMRGNRSFYSNISDDAWNFAFDCSMDSTPKSSQSRPWLFDKEGRPQSMIVVKNTFIDGYTNEDFDVEDTDAGPPVAVAKSCPVLLGRMKLPADTLPRKKTRARTVHLLQAGSAEMDRLVAESQLLGELPAASTALEVSAASEEDARKGHGSSQINMDLDAREPSSSAGSSLHAVGECRPCAWYWRPQGCDNGQNCRHCHLCPRGALKARRKAKIVSARKQERADRISPNGDESNAGLVPFALGSLI